MLSLEEALEQVLAAVPPATDETVPVERAGGRVLLKEVSATVDLPGFDNSAMDGYAVRSADIAGAGASNPVMLRVAGRIAAGETFDGDIMPGQCVRLFTGSPLPIGADAVVMQEDTRVEPDCPGVVHFLDGVQSGENVRKRGEDVSRGSKLGTAGQVLTAGHVALLSAVGCPRVRVGRRPVVGLIATGSELREAGQPLGPGQIYETNRATMSWLLSQAGAVPRVYPLVPDTPEATRSSMESALAECDLVVTSGGVSVGEFDFVKSAFEALGGELAFWKVAIKPGKPFVFGRRQGKLLFGLPGNPVSAAVTFHLLVRPALLRWQGGHDVVSPSHPGILAETLVNRGNRRHFMRVRVDADGQVRSAGAQGSHRLASLAAANGLVDVPPDTSLPEGFRVPVLRWG